MRQALAMKSRLHEMALALMHRTFAAEQPFPEKLLGDVGAVGGQMITRTAVDGSGPSPRALVVNEPRTPAYARSVGQPDVIDAWVRVSVVGIDLVTIDARVVVASIQT